MSTVHLQILEVVQLGEERAGAGDGAGHEVREPQPHPGGEGAGVGAAEGDPGGEVVLGVHRGDEVARVLQPLARAEVAHVLAAHVLRGVTLPVEPVQSYQWTF